MTTLNIRELAVHDLAPFSVAIENELVCLSGPSGSGKSLILRAVADLIEHQGDVFLDDNECSKTHPVTWRQWVGLLPAESAWWCDHVSDHFEQATEEYFAELGLSPASLNWEVSRCSTGEKQRLAIARLLQRKPKALLLDEPTASLDSDSVLRVEALIQQYRKDFNVPVIWVSHDREQIKRLTKRVLKLENHQVKETTV